MNNIEKSKLQQEVINSLSENPHGRLLLAPRIGKTKIGIDLIKRDSPKSVLWVTQEARLAKKEIPSEFKYWGVKDLSLLTTCTYKSLINIVGEFDWIILDEDQHLTEANSKNLLNGLLSYNNIISMTGTPSKHIKKLNLYEKLGLKTLYELDINTAVDIGLLSNYTINKVNIPLIKDKTKELNRIEFLIRKNLLGKAELINNNTILKITGTVFGELSISRGESKYGGDLYYVFGKLGKIGYVVITDKGELKGKLRKGEQDIIINNGIVHKPQPANLLISRARAIGESQLKTEITKFLISNLPGKKLIFSTTINQSKLLSKNIYNNKSDSKYLDYFQQDKIDHIVMVNKGGTGYTYKKIDHLIIVQSDSDGNGHTSQKISRTLLSQENYHANIWILNLLETQDEVWVNKTLQSFDPLKIKEVSLKELNYVTD